MKAMSAPSQVQSLLEAGLVALDVGDYDTALEKWNAVLEFDPEHPRAAKLVRDLEALVVRARGGRPRQRTNSGDMAIVVDTAESGTPDDTAVMDREPSPAVLPPQTGSWNTATDTERAALVRLQELLGEQAAQSNKRSEELVSARSQVSRLRTELAQRERALLEEREAQIELDARLNTLRSELDDSRGKAMASESEAAEARVSANELRAELEDNAAEVANLRAKVDELTPKVALLAARESALEGAVKRAEELEKRVAELNGLQAELAELKTSAAELTESLRTTELERKERASELETEREQRQAEADDRRAAERSHAGALAAATSELEQAVVTRDEAKARASLLETQLEQEVQRSRETAGLLSDAQAALAAAEAEKQELLSRLDEASRVAESGKEAAQALNELEVQHDELLTAHEELHNRTRSLEVDVATSENARNGIAERLTSLEDNYDRVLQRATGAEAQLENLRRERDEATKSFHDNENTLRTLRARQVALESEVRAMQETAREVRSLRQERSALDARLAKSAGRMQTMEREIEVLRSSGDSGGFSRAASSNRRVVPPDASLPIEALSPAEPELVSPLESPTLPDVNLQETADFQAIARSSPHQPILPEAEHISAPDETPMTPADGSDEPLMVMELLSETSPGEHANHSGLNNQSDIDDLLNDLTILESPQATSDMVEEFTREKSEPRMVEHFIGSRRSNEQPEATMHGLRMQPDDMAEILRAETDSRSDGVTTPPPAPAGRATRNADIMDYANRAPHLSADAFEKRSTLGASEAFVIQNVDGQLSFEDLLDVCGLPPAETRNILQNLYDRGIIDFETD
jgi:hypothetical protein